MSEFYSDPEQFNQQKTKGFLNLLETGGFVINGEFFPLKVNYDPELIPEVYRGDFIRTIPNNPTTRNTPGLSFVPVLISEIKKYEEALNKGSFTTFYLIPPNLLNNIQVTTTKNDKGKETRSISYKNVDDIPKDKGRLIDVVLESICHTINKGFDKLEDDKKLTIFDLRKAIINKIENDNFQS